MREGKEGVGRVGKERGREKREGGRVNLNEKTIHSDSGVLLMSSA